MRSSSMFLLIVAVLAAFFTMRILDTRSSAQVVPGRGTTLPGSRPVIDATNFPSLQAALDAIPAEGGVVRLPPGKFSIHEPLVLARGDVLLQGSGTATHIENKNQQGQPALVIQHSAGDKVKKEDRLWRIQLADFRITGNPQSGHGISALQIEEIFIQGVTSSYHGGDGIRLDRCYEDPRVSNSLITYNKGVGLNLLGCHDIVVNGNQFEENQDAIHCVDGFNLCLTGSCIDDHLGHGVVVENTYGSVIAGNMIEECNGTAIILDRDCYGDTISANVIAHNGAGVDLRDAHGCAVSANTFTIMAKDAVRVSGASGRIAITGNNFSNSYIGEGEIRREKIDAAAAGLVLESTSDNVISGNLFGSVRPKAVELRGNPSSRSLFGGNLLIDVTSDHEQLKESKVLENLEIPGK